MILNALRSTALASAVAFFAVPAFAGDVSFTLNNATTVDLMEFYASPSSVDDWEEDILGENILAAGASVEVVIADDRGCEYDIKAVFADGDEVVDQIDICTAGEYTISE
ncbi:MAG: hypothetical protein R3D60_02070 [Paracoccaceae bacterium]